MPRYFDQLIALDKPLLMAAEDDDDVQELALDHVHVGLATLASLNLSTAEILALVQPLVERSAPIAVTASAVVEVERKPVLS